MGYTNRWTSTDQVPQRAVDSGDDRPLRLARSDRRRQVEPLQPVRPLESDRASYGVDPARGLRDPQHLTLFNNFTYFLDDPINGDQFSQFDHRTVMGVNASHTIKGRFGPFDTETRSACRSRYDDIDGRPVEDRCSA